MTPMAYQGVMVDRCGACHGMWLEKRDLEVILQKKIAAAFDVGKTTDDVTAADAKPAHCHQCDLAMMKIEGAANVTFDWCERCGGMFFDKSELNVIDAFRED
jgi:Zn-finger nucleic acid-binding protein